MTRKKATYKPHSILQQIAHLTYTQLNQNDKNLAYF